MFLSYLPRHSKNYEILIWKSSSRFELTQDQRKKHKKNFY